MTTPKHSAPKRIILSPKRLAEFQKQVLIVLADYRTMTDPSIGSYSKNPLEHEGTRVDIAGRIIDNLKAVAKVSR